MTPEEARAIVARVMAGLIRPGMVYGVPLPTALDPWYCYTPDGGHSIAVIPLQAAALHPGEPPEELLVPAPVKAVIAAGYTVRPDGFIACDLPYSADLGLMAPPDTDEF